MSHIQNDKVRDELEYWLGEYDVKEKDIMYDEGNNAYIIYIEEDGNKTKVYLPERFSSIL